MSFQYLSFQRSPPAHLQYGQQVIVSPLITNDLREAKFVPDEGELPIEVAWVREDKAGQWTLVKREEQIKWRGEETSWRKVELIAPSREEVGLQGRQSCVRLAMWVRNQGQTRQGGRGQKQNGAGSSDLSRPFKKPKVGPGREISGPDLLASLVIDPYKATVRVMRDQEDVFLPVLTPPVTLSGHDRPSDVLKGGQTQKLSEIARLWHVPPSWTHRGPVAEEDGTGMSYIEIREELGYQLDKHVWDASLALMASLCLKPDERLIEHDQSRKVSARFLAQDLFAADRGCVSVEMGTGTGLLSLWLDKVCRSSALDPTGSSTGEGRQSSAGCRLFLTDLEDSLALAESNARLNAIETAKPNCASLEGSEAAEISTVSMLGLDWFSSGLQPELVEAIEGSCKDESDATASTASPRRPHLLVLASDCSYNPDAYSALAGTIKRLLAAGSASSSDSQASDGRQAVCLLAKKHRNQDEQSLWDALQKAGLQATLQQGWHDDYTKHANIAEGVNTDPGDAEEEVRDQEALGKCGIYLVALAKNGV